MKYAYFPGCAISGRLPEYGLGVEAVCRKLGVELVHLEFNCCGWPLRDESPLAGAYSSARNMALAGMSGLTILTPCKCCFGNLKHNLDLLKRSPGLAREVNRLLAGEGLKPDYAPVKHFLSVLAEDVAVDTLRSMAVKPLTGLKAACHYGCHALRPARITNFDNPLNPTVFERVVGALGAEPISWSMRLECCGHPSHGRDRTNSGNLAKAKLLGAGSAGADVVVTACPYCQLQFGREGDHWDHVGTDHGRPKAVLVTRLLTRALGAV